MQSKFILIATLLIAGCAKSPDAVAPVAAPADAYATLDCEQLKAERVSVSQEIVTLSAEQESAATNDTIGVILLGLPMASMAGNDKEVELASEKGKLQAIERQMTANACV